MRVVLEGGARTTVIASNSGTEPDLQQQTPRLACGSLPPLTGGRHEKPKAESSCGLLVVRGDGGAGWRHLDQELLHVPGAGGAALGAQAAVKADVFVLHYHARGF